MGIISFIAIIVLLALIINLKGRVSRLESLVGGNQKVSMPQQSAQNPVMMQSMPQTIPVQQPAQAPQIPLVPSGPDPLQKFGAWLKEDWLLKLGGLLILIGFGWFVSYAFLHGWIGPQGRIVLGIVTGLILIILGWWRARKYIHQGGIFMVLGSTVVILTTFAGMTLYDYFTPFTALGTMFISTAFVAVASVKYNSRSLALSSIILAGIVPALVNTYHADDIMMFSYLLVVVLGTIWITLLTGRRELTLAALVMVAIYSAPHLVTFYSHTSDTLLFFAFIFAGLFFITNTAGIVRSNGRDITPDLVTAAGNGLLLLAWIMTNAQDEWKSLIIAAWMVLFMVGAFLTYRITGKKEPFYTYAAVGIAMLAAATSAELEGASLTIAYIVESVLVSIVAYVTMRDLRIAEKASLLLVGPIILSVPDIISSDWSRTMFQDHFVVLFLIAISMLGLGSFFLMENKRKGNTEMSFESGALLIVGSAYAYLLLWLSLNAEIADKDQAVMIALVIYTIVGLITYIIGRSNNKKTLQMYGGVLLVFVVGRLLFVDVWKMALSGRIITFFLVGALLMSTAFLGKKKKMPVIENANQ